ncbi:hypothetical protein BT96DRAFT_1004470 [Gymnopus androsaceus JB14]|uniref:Uncharacterized protein n=1 Tax=Gymnopus androsaceus JB14 TaxID=1447944 RepID=A0A6A4GRS6_9AGAR|nr:hypothetical protein BT96DRAFT_1004470 [Gymnopus androsaceus JB14]
MNDYQNFQRSKLPRPPTSIEVQFLWNQASPCSIPPQPRPSSAQCFAGKFIGNDQFTLFVGLIETEKQQLANAKAAEINETSQVAATKAAETDEVNWLAVAVADAEEHALLLS